MVPYNAIRSDERNRQIGAECSQPACQPVNGEQLLQCAHLAGVVIRLWEAPFVLTGKYIVCVTPLGYEHGSAQPCDEYSEYDDLSLAQERFRVYEVEDGVQRGGAEALRQSRPDDVT